MNIMLKTIFQSQEMRVGEREAIAVRAPLGYPNMHRRPKAVAFRRVEAPKSNDSMSWCLQLKKSSASTNVSILNLTESESFEFDTSENTQSSSSDSEDREEYAKSQNKMKNSGLVFAKDSVIGLNGKNSKLNQHIYSLKAESAALLKNLQHRQQEVEELDKISNKLEAKLSHITMKLEEICEKRDSLNNLKYDILKDMSAFQGFPLGVESRSEAPTLLRDLNQNIASLCSGIKELQHSLETTAHRTEPDRGVQKQEMLMTATEEIRNSVAQICVNFEAASILLKNVQRTVVHMNTRIESFISQGNCAQEQHDLLMNNIQELRASMKSSPSL